MDKGKTIMDNAEDGTSSETSNANKTMVSELCENLEGLALSGNAQDATFLLEDIHINELVEADIKEELESTSSMMQIATPVVAIESMKTEDMSNVEPDLSLEITLTDETLKNSLACELTRHELEIKLEDVTITNSTQFKSPHSDQDSESRRSVTNDTFCDDLAAEANLNATYIPDKKEAELSGLEIASSHPYRDQSFSVDAGTQIKSPGPTLVPEISTEIEKQDGSTTSTDTTFTRSNENFNVSTNAEKQGNINFNLTFDSANPESVTYQDQSLNVEAGSQIKSPGPILDLTLTADISTEIEKQDGSTTSTDTTFTRSNENLNVSSNAEKQSNINLTFDSANPESVTSECIGPVSTSVQGIETKDVLSVGDDILFAQLNESCEKKIADLKRSLPAEVQTVKRVDFNDDIPSEQSSCMATIINSTESLKSEDTTDLIKAFLDDLLESVCEPTLDTKNVLPCSKEAEEMVKRKSCGELSADKIQCSNVQTSLNTITKQSEPTSVDVASNKTPLRVLANQQGTNKRTSFKLDDPFNNKIMEKKEENKENFIRQQMFPTGQYDLSIFSDSPAKPQKRNSILRLFDPLHESVIIDDSLPQIQEINECMSTNNVFRINTPLVDIDDFSTDANQKYIDVFVQIKNLLDDSEDLDTVIENLPNTITAMKTKMTGAIDEKTKLEQELNTLKLEVNHLQQERSSLELELHQKEEIILEQQVQAQKRESQYKQDMKQLQGQIVSISSPENNVAMKSLQEEICLSKRREAQMVSENRKLCEKLASCMDTMSGYESMLIKVMPEHEKLQEEHDTTKQHLATLEVAFSDVHRKYERCKTVIYGYKANEEALTKSLNESNLLAKQFEDKYEKFKAHATAELEKANKLIASAKDKQQAEVTNCKAIIRKLEIKNASLQQALDQKTKECSELTALCDEMAGPTP